MAGTTTVATLIAELRVNSAQFRAEMDAAGKKTRELGGHAALSGQQLSRFGAIALEHVAPGLQGSRVAMEQLIQRIVALRGVIGGLGTFAVPVFASIGTAIGGFLAGNALANFRELNNIGLSFSDRLKVAVGGTDALEEHFKALNDEAKEFRKHISASLDTITGLEAALAKIRGTDPFGALEVEQARRQRERGILGPDSPFGPLPSDDKSRALRLSEQLTLAQGQAAVGALRKARDEADQKFLEQITKERDEQVKKWQEETQALADQLKVRLKLRQDFQSQLGQGGLGGTLQPGISAGLEEVRALSNSIKKEALDLAFREREGLGQTDVSRESLAIRDEALRQADQLRVKFAGITPVLEAIDRAIASVEFGNFGKELAAARIQIEAMVPRVDELEAGIGAFAAQMIQSLPATDAAADANRKLSATYIELANAIYVVRQQAAALAAEQ